MGLLDIFKPTTVQIIFLPALIAAALYALTVYIALPLLRKHRDRYRQYLPLDSLSQRTSSLRDRMADAFVRFLVSRHRQGVEDASGPSSVGGSGRSGGDAVRESSSGDDGLFAEEDAERLVGFDVRRSERERMSSGWFGVRG